MHAFSSESLSVSVRNASFGYDSNLILDNINVSVPIGCIYGLLGPSGCGKTTLLKCVLSRLKPRSGECLIFGFKSGSKESRVPGPGIGYMPQEMGLNMELTIEETLKFFGNIFGMQNKDIKSQIEFLIKLLQLPKMGTRIGSLSGGQKRRVSLAIALFHSPPLLILDEPTVGVDPVLRQTIWDHLIKLINNGFTIIMTTHYIEEARSAGRVGFMRDGKIIAEDDPQKMIQRFGTITLEETFLKVCLKIDPLIIKENDENNIVPSNESEEIGMKPIQIQQLNQNDNINVETNNDYWIKMDPNHNDNEMDEQKEKFLRNNNREYNKNIHSNFYTQLMALIGKNFLRLFRNLPLLLIVILLPSVYVTLMFFTMGTIPKDIYLAVFNEERNDEFGDLFVNSFDNRTVSIRRFDTFEDGYNDVKMGNSWGLIEINKKFSAALRLRQLYGLELDEDTLEQSLISIHMDMSNQLLGFSIYLLIYEAMMRFGENLAVSYGVSPEHMKPPILFEEPIYGTKELVPRNYAIPGLFILLAFFGTMSITVLSIIEERITGLCDRTIVSGISAFQFFLSHALTQFILIIFQTLLMLFVCYVMFETTLSGSIFIVVILTLSQGFSGIIFGLMISALTSDLLTAATFGSAFFFPGLILSGVFWPLQYSPRFLNIISTFLPFTLACDAMRNVMFRGWDLLNFHVYIGFVATFMWGLMFYIIGVFFIKRNL